MSTESPSTTDRLAEIEARAENRVPGHWHAVSIEFRGQTSHSVKSNVGSVLAHTGYGPVGGSSHANAEFMANAPADIEFLLAENERLRARLDTAEGQLKDPGLDWLIDWAMATDRDARDHYFHINDGESCDCRYAGEGVSR